MQAKITLRQAAQQALEALERNIHYTQTHLQDFDAAYNRHPSTENERGVITDDIEDAFAAITALRAALAEPEQEPFMVVSPECAERGCMAHDDRVDGSGVVLHLREKQEPQTTHWEGCEAVHPECKATPRKPLTSEQLTKIELGLRVYADNDRYDLSLHDFARAIERAHGIGEQHE